jgi:hypothetical protein
MTFPLVSQLEHVHTQQTDKQVVCCVSQWSVVALVVLCNRLNSTALLGSLVGKWREKISPPTHTIRNMVPPPPVYDGLI